MALRPGAAAAGAGGRRGPALGPTADPASAAHSLHRGAAFLLAVKFENSAPYPHVSGPVSRSPHSGPVFGGEKAGRGPPVQPAGVFRTFWYWSSQNAICWMGCGFVPPGWRAGFSPIARFYISVCACGAGRGAHFLSEPLSGGCWCPPPPALPNAPLSCPVLTRSPRSFLNSKPARMTVTRFAMCWAR